MTDLDIKITEDQFRKRVYEAHEENKAEAQYILGLCFLNGVPRPRTRDPEKAIHWFRKATAQGHEKAQEQLFWMIEYGMGVSVNRKQRLNLWKFAASLKHTYSMIMLAKHYEIKQADTSFSWYSKAAFERDPEALFEVAKCFRFGKGIKQDGTKSDWYLELAALYGHPLASMMHADHLASLNAAPTIIEAFIEYYTVAANAGFQKARDTLDTMTWLKNHASLEYKDGFMCPLSLFKEKMSKSKPIRSKLLSDSTFLKLFAARNGLEIRKDVELNEYNQELWSGEFIFGVDFKPTIHTTTNKRKASDLDKNMNKRTRVL